VEVQTTSKPGELDSALHRAGSRPIVVAGGDGSLHAVVAALHRRNDLKDAVLGLLPLGTGNDFARANDIPLDVEEAAATILEGHTRAMDLIVDEVGEIVVNSVHAGTGAQASRSGEKWKDRLHKIGIGGLNLGRLGYPIGALSAAVNPPFVRVRVEVDGQVIVDVDERILMVAVGNGPTVGGGTELTPYADPGNGQARVRLGYLQLAKNDCAAAERQFTYAIDGGLPGVDAYVGLATCLGRRNDLAAAARALQFAKEREPDNPVVAANLGILQAARGDLTGAIQSLSAALARDPDLHEARFNLALAYAKSGRRPEAAAAARELLQRLPPAAPQRPEVERLLRAVQ